MLKQLIGHTSTKVSMMIESLASRKQTETSLVDVHSRGVVSRPSTGVPMTTIECPSVMKASRGSD